MNSTTSKTSDGSVSSRDYHDPPRSRAEFYRISQAVSFTLAGYAVIGGSITLIGWALEIPRLTDWNNDNVSMFANTAMGVVIGGIALILLCANDRIGPTLLIARTLGVVVALLGGLTIIEQLTNTNLGIDTVLFDRDWGQRASAAPMRMGLPAATSFLLIGAALGLATFSGRPRKPAAALALGVVGIVSLSLIGYWYGADQLYLIPRYTGIARQTSTMLMSLGVGLIIAIPEFGMCAILARDDAGGLLARRLMVPIIGIPLLLGWLRIMGQNDNLYDAQFGTAVRTLAEIMLLGGLLWWTADGISRHAQLARAAEQAAKDADRRKDEFLATLAHELRNPLAPIGTALEIIKHTDGDRAVLEQARDTMERQFAQMVRLVDDLLDVGRITRDKLELRLQRLELAPIIHQAVEISRPLIDAGQHRLTIELPTEPIWIEADAVRLAQVFSNLLNNACKFSEPKSPISISAKQAVGNVPITVADSGIGIAPDHLGSIFEMFSQVDSSLERTRGGLGIGLTLVKRLIELHRGRIEAHSEGLGRGSQFTVTLPTVENAPVHSPAPSIRANSPANAAGKRVLVIDDNLDAAKTLTMILRLSGHTVETVHDGPAAIEKAKEYQPGIMLLDIGLPGMNGYDVCRAIRSQPWGQKIRIIALTGWGQDQDRQNARDAGFDDHLVKPVDLQALSRTMAAQPT
ncbi:MAG TPA: ATP-binding protein [Lacipirellulaceae bacterium]|nr:ATP-binding protein [Lacipirellulaceae bacterium]